MLRCPLHTKTAFLFCNPTSFLDHLSTIPMSSILGVDEEVYTVSAKFRDIMNR